MKVDSGKSDEGPRVRKSVMNGESSHATCEESLKRSRSRSKSPRSTMNGDLMFDAALYAPERPKRNRKKPEEEIFTPVKEPVQKLPVVTKKRKAPPEKTAKKTTAKSTKTPPTKRKNENENAKETDDDGSPKPKRRCTVRQKKNIDISDEDNHSDSEDNQAKTSKPAKQPKAQPKGKPKVVKKTATAKDASKGAKTPGKAAKKLPDKNAKSPVEKEDTDEVTQKETAASKSTPSKAPAKKKKTATKDNTEPSVTDTEQTPKVKERASKPKKSPAKIEIDGIEITELSDLNSSKEDDFNSSRDSIINNTTTENDTSAETVIYDEKENGAVKMDNHAKSKDPWLTSSGKDTNDTGVKVDNQTELGKDSKQYSVDGTVVSAANCTSVPSASHVNGSPVAATSSSLSSRISPVVKTEGSSPSKADPAPATYSSLPHNHTSTPLTSSHTSHLSSTPKQAGQPEGEKKLPCPQPGCKYVGKSGVLLRKHLRNHGVFECAHCEFSGNQFELLQTHMQEKHPTRWGRKKCRKCCRHIRLDLHDEHEASCNGTKIWKCEDCNNEFPYESTLKEHRKKHKTKEHPCTKCKRTFYTQVSLDTHMQLHDADSSRTFPCSVCSRVFKSEQSAKNHEETAHQVDLPCTADGCTETFKTQRLLNAHKKQQHKISGASTTMFKCEHEGCGMEFPRMNHLKKHASVHTGERRFSCEWEGCQKTFRHNANLKIHYMQHTGEKPIHCEHCDFACRQRSSILFHMKTKHPGMPIPRTDRGGHRASSPRRRRSSTDGGAAANSSMDEEHTQDYEFGSPDAGAEKDKMNSAETPSASASASAGVNSSTVSVTAVDPKVYDFPDDDEEEPLLDLPVKKTAKSPIRSLSEMESRLFNSSSSSIAEKTDKAEKKETVENVPKDRIEPEERVAAQPSEESTPGEEEHPPEEEKDDVLAGSVALSQDQASNPAVSQDQASDPVASQDQASDPVASQDQASDPAASQDQASDPGDLLDQASNLIDSQEQASNPTPSSVSESVSQNSSKFSEFAQEHVSENFPMNSCEGTATTSATPPEEAQPSIGEQPTTEDDNSMTDEPPPENPIQGALDTTDDLDYHMNGNESDVLDDKMLRSPMSNISEDMRALDMPHVSTDSTSADLIQEADLAMSSSSPGKKEHRHHDEDSGMPPEINAEVDALLESGLLDGHATTKDPQVTSHSSPQDSFHNVLAPPHSHVSSSHPNTPSAPPAAPPGGLYAGGDGNGGGGDATGHGAYSTGGYTPSYEQQPQSNVSHHTPEQDQRVPPASYPLPEYPPLPSPASALQQLPPSSTTPSSSSYLPPVYGISSQASPLTLPGYGAVVSSSYPITSVSPYRSPPTSSASAAIPSFAGSGLAPVVTSATSFLDLFPGTCALPSVSRPDTVTTSSTAVPSFSTSPYSTSAAASSAGRDLFGHYFPGAAPPDPMSGLSLAPPPAQDPQRGGGAYPASSQAAGFQALQRSSAELLQRASASALPTMNYPSVTESLARLNPATTQSSLWMPPGTDERSRSWAQASPMLMPPELDAASSLSRNPFSSARPEYNFEAAAAAAALGKRAEPSFPGVVPQSVAGTEHRSYDPVGSYMGASSSHFGPGAAAAAAAANYAAAARGMPDYRSPAAASATDMYGRHVAAPPHLGLDKYYSPYSRDSMYRSSGLAAPPPPHAPNPFMPPATSTPYAGNPMYQHGAGAAGTDAYSKYLPGSAEHRPADYFHHQATAPPRPPTADPYDPYRRSVIHNMMTRYY